MGGLSKKAYQINQFSKEDPAPALLLDAGNLLFKHSTVAQSQELITAEGLMEIYQQMAYDAVAVGPHDLAAGVVFLKNPRFKDFPWLSANLTDQNHKPLFPAVKILERSAMKIGIIGLTGPIGVTSQEIIVADWRKLLPAQLEKLARECQLIIVLSSLSGEDNAELARLFPGVHMLISADRQQGNITPRVDNQTMVTQTISQGKYLGVLNIDWIPGSSWLKGQGQQPSFTNGRAKRTSNYSSNFIALSKSFPEDPKIAAAIDVIKQRINLHNQQSTSPDASKNEAGTAAANLAGFARCRECHPQQEQFWRTTRHAGAYTTLQGQRQTFNLDCLPCHVTRNPAQEHSGQAVEGWILTLPQALQSVGCEACHGAGLAHADSPEKFKLSKKVNEKICLACHSKERDPAFDYRQKKLKVSCPAG